MTNLLLFLPVALVAILDMTLFPEFLIFGVRPDITLIVLTWSANLGGTQRGQIMGFAGGLIEDALSVSPLGFHALVRLAHAAITGRTRGAMMRDSLLTPVMLVLLALVVRWIAALILAGLFSLESVIARLLSVNSVLHAAITVVIAPVVFFLFDRIFGDISRRIP